MIILVGILIAFDLVAVGFKNTSVIYNALCGQDVFRVIVPVLQRVVIIDVLSSLPLVLGFALMI